jgi:hypothetical protein
VNTISLVINGERQQASDGATFERLNPPDGSIATTGPAATVPDALAAADAALMTTQASGRIIPSDLPGRLAIGVYHCNAPARGNTVVMKAVVMKASGLCPATHSIIVDSVIVDVDLRADHAAPLSSLIRLDQELLQV